MFRQARTVLAGWFTRARRIVRVREPVAAAIAAVALVVGPVSVLAYGRWADRDLVTVQTTQWAISPKTIYATEGVPVRLKLVAEDVVHAFVINGLPVKSIELIPGKTEYVTFTPEKAGTYYYQCTMYCGLRHAAMFGQLIVAPRR